MIAQLKGSLLYPTPTHVILDVNGVGYEVRISLHTFSHIKDQAHCQLFTYHYIKGDVQALYGFSTLEEKQWFLHLININSIGPRTALTILSSLSPEELQEAIVHQKIEVLKNIKGIGIKAAQRIVLELQNLLQTGAPSGALTATPMGANNTAQEALAALIKLGVSATSAQKALAQVRSAHPGEVSVETLIKEALQVS